MGGPPTASLLTIASACLYSDTPVLSEQMRSLASRQGCQRAVMASRQAASLSSKRMDCAGLVDGNRR